MQEVEDTGEGVMKLWLKRLKAAEKNTYRSEFELMVSDTQRSISSNHKISHLPGLLFVHVEKKC